MIAVWFIIHDVVLAWTGQEVQWITWKEMDICNQAAEKGKKKCLLQEHWTAAGFGIYARETFATKERVQLVHDMQPSRFVPLTHRVGA